MSGLKYWANESGKNAVSILLIGFGVLLMVVTKMLLARFFTAAIVIGICFIGAGTARFMVSHHRTKR